MEDEQSQLSSMIKQYSEDEAPSSKLLEDMEYLLHAVDNAKVFIDRGAY